VSAVLETTQAVQARLDDELSKLPTPAYVYDLDEVRRSHSLLRDALPAETTLFYSLKANPHHAIVRTLSRLGCSMEICSEGELDIALGAARVPPTDVLYTGPGKRDAEVAHAVRMGVRWFSVDSPAGLDQVEDVAAAAGVHAACLLRLNDPDAAAAAHGLTMTGVASQFGADTGWVLDEPESFSSLRRAKLVGLHLYLGSNVDGEDALVAQFEASIASARRIATELDLKLELLNLGGGFGAPYARSGELPVLSGLAARLEDLLDSSFPGWRRGRPMVAFESGRYLTATCGTLLARVLDVKTSHGKPVVVLESGINHLGGMSGLRRVPPVLPDVDRADDEEPPMLEEAIVAGPLCTPLDTWSKSGELPSVEIGDVVRVPNVGAYGLHASLLGFLCHPAPLEVVTAGGEIVEISQLELDRRPVEPAGSRRTRSREGGETRLG
jgi:diaminopimelate decarboxylase